MVEPKGRFTRSQLILFVSRLFLRLVSTLLSPVYCILYDSSGEIAAIWVCSMAGGSRLNKLAQIGSVFGGLFGTFAFTEYLNNQHFSRVLDTKVDTLESALSTVESMAKNAPGNTYLQESAKLYTEHVLRAIDHQKEQNYKDVSLLSVEACIYLRRVLESQDVCEQVTCKYAPAKELVACLNSVDISKK